MQFCYLQSNSCAKGCQEEILRSTHNASGGPAARLEKRESARTPRAPAGDSVPCTPVYDGISDVSVDKFWCIVVFILKMRVFTFEALCSSL